MAHGESGDSVRPWFGPAGPCVLSSYSPDKQSQDPPILTTQALPHVTVRVPFPATCPACHQALSEHVTGRHGDKQSHTQELANEAPCLGHGCGSASESAGQEAMERREHLLAAATLPGHFPSPSGLCKLQVCKVASTNSAQWW